MTDLEKAEYAASVLANYKFQGITAWIVEETRTTYQVFGETKSPVELEMFSSKPKNKYVVKVMGGISKQYIVEEAYLIARSLERGD